jgi:hypothetical protein
MNRAFAVCLATIGLTASLAHANLLLNGDFNNPNSVASATNWSTWSYGGGWANHQNNTSGPLDGVDGSYYMACGGAGNAGGGVYQIVPGTAGTDYSLSVDAGAQAWWRPQGEMRLFFLDAASDVLSSTNPVIVNTGPGYDTGMPWANYSLSMVSPVGTTQVKVEFAMNGNDGGTVWFDNADLEVVPEPSTLALVAGSLLPLLGYRFRRGHRHS